MTHVQTDTVNAGVIKYNLYISKQILIIIYLINFVLNWYILIYFYH